MKTMIDLASYITPAELRRLIAVARAEDLGPDSCDLTSQALVPAAQQATAIMRSRKPGVLSGAALLPVIINAYDSTLRLIVTRHDGDALQPGDEVARFAGSLRSILAVERIALNFATHLSGIATLTACYVAAVAAVTANASASNTARICDTRKTIPGLRGLAKYAVVCGGGVSHRIGLYDAMLVKDNHIAHIPPTELPAALKAAFSEARRINPKLSFIEVEVDTLAQLEMVLPTGPDIVLLDNMPPATLRQAVAMRDRLTPAVQLEASGGVNLDTVASIAATGVDRISVGALTHSAPALDLGLDID